MSDAEARVDATELARIEAVLADRWPESRINPALTREQALMDLLGSPQLSAPVVHVAGTNGKTSTSRMIESLVRAAGLRTGLFTSPHLHTPQERICIDGEPVDVARFAASYDEIAPFVELVDQREGRLTWFEVLTGMAFACFADAPVEAMIVECGIGGTWDSTNVVDPATCVITPIGMDHSNYLGDTLAEIAEQKAGIITAAVPVITAAQDSEAMAVLADKAAEMGAPLLRAGVDFSIVGRDLAVGGQMLDIETSLGLYEEIFLPLHGRHQAENAAVALAAAEAFLGGRGLSAELVREGLSGVMSPGRLEVLRNSPTVVADAAHNPHGMASLTAAVTEVFGFPRIVAVVAIFADKDASAMLAELANVATDVIVTRNSSPRSLAPDELADLALEVWDDSQVRVAADLAEALEMAVTLADEEPPGAVGVVVTGSVITVADAKRLLGRG